MKFAYISHVRNASLFVLYKLWLLLILLIPSISQAQRPNNGFQTAHATPVHRLHNPFAAPDKQSNPQQLRHQLIVPKLRFGQRERDQQIQQQQLLPWVVVGGLLVLILGGGLLLYQARQTHHLLSTQKQAIEQQAEQLNALNAEKDRLFSIIGHDLRGPISSLKQGLNLLRQQASHSADWQEQVDQLAYNADQLYSLTNNLLYWSLLQQNGLRTHAGRVPIMDIVDDALSQLDGLLRAKRLLVRYTDPLERPIVWADEQQMAIAIRNILHNAIKFSAYGGELRLGVQTQAKQTHLLIGDEGPGFRQTKASPSGQGRGTGLGLPLATSLMEANHGRLSISSATGQGTTIWLSWPALTLNR